MKMAMIAPLIGPNYTPWKVHCRVALKKVGVWGIMSITKVTPAEDADDKVKDCYAARQDKAVATTVCSVHPVDPSIL